jgi:hypothetical protein
MINTKVPSILLDQGGRHFGVEFSRGWRAICPDTPLTQAEAAGCTSQSTTDWHGEGLECHAA